MGWLDRAFGVLERLADGPERRSRVDVKSPKDPALGALFGGGDLASGVAVTEHTALNCSAVWAAVRVLSEAESSLPLVQYRRRPDGGRERAEEHSLYRLLHDEPNPEMTSMVYRETSMSHVLLWGNAYSEIVRRLDGQPVALWPLPPSNVRPHRMPDGRLSYQVFSGPGWLASESAPAGVETTVLPAENVLHIPGLGFDGLMGYSVVRMARESLGLSLAAETFGAAWFGNGSKPGGVLEHPGRLSKEAAERLRSDFEKVHRGPSRGNRMALLEEGMKFHPTTIPPEDAQFLQTRKFQVGEVARWFNVPPHKLGDLERSTNNNIEQQSIDFVVHSVRPWLVRFEQEINRKLLMPSERKDYYVEHLIDALLRGDQESRFRSYATARQWGWMSANDVRLRENQNPIEGGDTYLSPSNMVPADMLGKSPATTPPAAAA